MKRPLTLKFVAAADVVVAVVVTVEDAATGSGNGGAGDRAPKFGASKPGDGSDEAPGVIIPPFIFDGSIGGGTYEEDISA
jgi:hypothetical protein